MSDHWVGVRQSKELFKQVFESNHDAILVIDPETDAIIDVNPAATEMLGYPRDELLSLSPSNLHPDELDKFRTFVNTVFEDGDGWTDELTCKTKDRGRIPTEISASRIEHNDRQVMVAMVRDITERKEREQFQRRLYEITADPDRTFDEKLQAVFELGCERYDVEHGGIARIDPATDCFEVETITGKHDHLSPDKQYPLSETYCRLVTDDGQTAVVTDPVNKGFEEKLCYTQFGVEVYLGTHLELEDGDDRTLFFVSNEPRADAYSDADRTFLHLMGEWVRKELEQNQHETQLQQKNDRLRSFASLLAHELRNPVTIGQIYSQQLPDETEAEAIEYVTEAFDRIEDMINVMLMLTRGREAIGERTPVKLTDVAKEAWSEVDAPEATLEIEIENTIQADETYVRHLFQNVLENAVEHGGIDVTVTVGELPSGFYVADDGAGIPATERDAVFEAGYTTASDNGGTGLGLAFVKKFAEVYEWEYAVTESAAGGARFEFTNVNQDA